MLRFWAGISRRVKWLVGIVLLGVGWLLNNLLGNWAVEWATAAVKTPGAKRMIASATLYLAANPFATFFAVVVIAIFVIVLLAYFESRKAVMASGSETNTPTSTPKEDAQPDQSRIAAPPPNLRGAAIREVAAYQSVTGHLSVNNLMGDYSPAYVFVITNEPIPNVAVGRAERVGAIITFVGANTIHVPAGLWLGDGGKVDFGVGTTHELVIAVANGSKLSTAEWRKHVAGHPPPAYTPLVGESYKVNVRLYNDIGMAIDFALLLTLNPIGKRALHLLSGA